MGDELSLLLEVFHKIKKAGGQATLSVATAGGKTKIKLEIGTTAAPPMVSSPPSSPTGRRHHTRLPLQRQKLLLLVHLSNYFPRHLLILGGARCSQWRSCTCRPFPPSTWTAPHRPLHLHQHLHCHLQHQLQRHLHADHLSATSTTTTTTTTSTAATVADVSTCAVNTVAAIVARRQTTWLASVASVTLTTQ